MASRRPRRSRIYDSNYNIGENMYKSAIDRLDEKYSSSSSSTAVLNRVSPRISPLPELSPARQIVQDKYTFPAECEDDLNFARARASKIICEDTILDSRTGRKALKLENEFDDQVSRRQVQNTLSRIQASKKLLSSLDVDNAVDSSISRSEATYKKRSIKISSDVSASTTQKSSLTKWSKDTDYNDSQSFAALRARQSAQRIQDIENDMVQREQRQLQREQRAANLKKILADESDYTSNMASGIASIKITKAHRITSC